MNNVTVIGNIGGEVKLRKDRNDKPIAHFSIGDSVYGKNPKSGEFESYTQWWDVTVFGTDAERAAEHLGKGSSVAITGEVALTKWQPENGDARWNLAIRGRWSFAGSKSGGGQGRGNGTDGGAPAADDDIPF